jgi:hypothetical protein
VPQEEPLQPAPLKLHATAVFEVPVIVAVKESVPEVGTVALVGLMLSKTAAAVTRVTVAEAVFVGSATLVTVRMRFAGEGMLAGGVYRPPFEMVPHAAPLQPGPATFQVTDVLEDPVTVAANCCVVPSATVALFGLTFTTT